jgi:hypothetical protein
VPPPNIQRRRENRYWNTIHAVIELLERAGAASVKTMEIVREIGNSMETGKPRRKTNDYQPGQE